MRFPSLRRRSDFETFRQGRSHLPSIEGRYVRIIWKDVDQPSLYGFKVSRYTGNAVRRNRIKRILRGYIMDLPPAHYLFVIKSRVKELSDRQISSVLRGELSLLIKEIRESLCK